MELGKVTAQVGIRVGDGEWREVGTVEVPLVLQQVPCEGVE